MNSYYATNRWSRDKSAACQPAAPAMRRYCHDILYNSCLYVCIFWIYVGITCYKMLYLFYFKIESYLMKCGILIRRMGTYGKCCYFWFDYKKNEISWYDIFRHHMFSHCFCCLRQIWPFQVKPLFPSSDAEDYMRI